MIITDTFELSTVYSGFAISVAAGSSGLFATQTGKLKVMFTKRNNYYLAIIMVNK
jgi:hypothetical protein